MSRNTPLLARFGLVRFCGVARLQRTAAATAMLFCNGGMGSASGLTPAQISGLRASGMDTMVIFNRGVAANGDFTYGSPICSNGVYVGPSNWGALLNQCRIQPSSIKRIEICIGGWTDPSWINIKNLVTADALKLSWPSDRTGWRLQVQTNDLSQGLSNDWVDVSGATFKNELHRPIDTAHGSVFYRLANL